MQIKSTVIIVMILFSASISLTAESVELVSVSQLVE
jgi:hypothetical protein